MQLRCTALPLPRARRSLSDPRKERWSLKLTRHNGRAGKHGTYNPKHNDRSFEIANSEHIDPERVQQNIYWDCYNGIRSALHPKSEDSLADTFEEVEKLYYKLHYTNFTEKQNERNAKIRHTERNRSTEDLLTSKKTCPEESIYQLGTLESHASPKELFQIATEFMDEFHERFGKHVHILDWALHLDEGTPHIHERHVFDCENKYGEIAPQQEKALEALGFELPKPDKPLGRYNNRKITFDAACRTMLFEIARRHGLELDEVPEYGGRAYLEKQDYIMAKQKEQLAQQEKAVQEQTVQLENLKQEHENENLLQVRRTTYQSLTIMRNGAGRYLFGLAKRAGANGKQGNIGLHHISNHNAAKKYYCSSKQDYRKIDNCPYKAGNQKACHRANQRKYSSVCSTKAAAAAGRNRTA